jgi:hypothetical protein
MSKYVFAIVIAFGALFGLSVQAAPLASSTSAVQSQVSGSAVEVRHCRYWSGGWGCGWGGHSRYWSHRRHGSRW